MFTKDNIQDLNHTHTDLQFKHVSKEKLEQIKLKIRKNKEIENRRLLTVLMVILFLFVGTAIIIYFNYFTI